MAKDKDTTIAPPPAPGPTKRPLEVLVREKDVPSLVAAGVKGLRRWDDLYEVTESELDAAIREYHSIRLGA